ncbi:hypothetical protein [Sorangium sp. So ce362]|uniref:hypothetical protein n=1 Tax=Sorangium sp. So ce362 TaxID=3133303 RepID=UPI003F63BBBD
MTVSSVAHRQADISFDDLQSGRAFRGFSVYGQSRRANLLFTYELQRRLAAAGAKTIALGAHPGGSHTEITRSAPGLFRGLSQLASRLGLGLGQSAAMGALASLRAAVDPGARGRRVLRADRAVRDDGVSGAARVERTVV